MSRSARRLSALDAARRAAVRAVAATDGIAEAARTVGVPYLTAKRWVEEPDNDVERRLATIRRERDERKAQRAQRATDAAERSVLPPIDVADNGDPLVAPVPLPPPLPPQGNAERKALDDAVARDKLHRNQATRLPQPDPDRPLAEYTLAKMLHALAERAETMQARDLINAVAVIKDAIVDMGVLRLDVESVLGERDRRETQAPSDRSADAGDVITVDAEPRDEP